LIDKEVSPMKKVFNGDGPGKKEETGFQNGSPGLAVIV
jgi:hypothetical protein